MAKIGPLWLLCIVLLFDGFAACGYGVYLVSHQSGTVPAQINSAILATITAVLVIAGILSGVVLAGRHILAVLLDRIDAVFRGILERLDASATDPADHCVAWHYEVTVPMPVLAAPVPAVVPVQRGDHLDDYARGYVHGLSREPMEASNVIPINGYGS